MTTGSENQQTRISTYSLGAGWADSLDLAIAAVLQLLYLGRLVALVEADADFVSRSHVSSCARKQKRTELVGDENKPQFPDFTAIFPVSTEHPRNNVHFWSKVKQFPNESKHF